MSKESYGLVLSFPDQSESFVHGFEAGIVWEALKQRQKSYSITMHNASREVISRICAHYGYGVEFERYDDCWCVAIMTLEPPRPHLRLVS